MVSVQRRRYRTRYTRADGYIAAANSRQLSLRRRDENQFSRSQLTRNDYLAS